MKQPESGNRWGSKRRLHLRVTLLTSAEQLATCLFLILYWQVGRADGRIVLGLLTYSALANIVVITGVASGWSQRLKDPSMTVVQMVVSGIRDLLGCYLLPGLWFVFVFNLFIALPFGSLKFTRRKFAWFWLATCVGLGFVFLGYPTSMQIGFTGRAEKWLLWVFLSATLARLMIFNSRISIMRRKLRSDGVALAQVSRRVERERVAMEMHETVLQTFLGLVFRLTALTEQLPSESAQRRSIESALRDGEQALVEGRELVAKLRSPMNGEWPLVKALQQAGDDQSYDTGLAFKVHVHGDELPLLAEARSGLEAIVLQALANAFHHSQGQTVWLGFRFSTGCLIVSVRDDGRGMANDVDGDDSAAQFGIHIMRERAESLGAALSIVSRCPGGTRVVLRLPGSRAYDAPHSLLPNWLNRLRRAARNG